MRPVKRRLGPQPTQDPIAENARDGRQGRADLGPKMVKARIHEEHHRELRYQRPLQQIPRGRPKQRHVKRCGGLDAVLQESAARMQKAVEEGEGGGHDLVDDVGTDRKNRGVGPCRLSHERQPMFVHPCQVRTDQFLQQAPSQSYGRTGGKAATIARPRRLVEHRFALEAGLSIRCAVF